MPIAMSTTDTMRKSTSSLIVLFLFSCCSYDVFSARKRKSRNYRAGQSQPQYYQRRRIVGKHQFAYFAKVDRFRAVKVAKLTVYSRDEQQGPKACHND